MTVRNLKRGSEKRNVCRNHHKKKGIRAMGYYPTSDAMDWITDDDRGREINGRGGNDQFYGGAGN
ncbi:MAG: hypothetical protein VX394_00940, partial [Pseudomonadota bacterium]|nr:hypothetical protein [Pseudomonadota bacterium]